MDLTGLRIGKVFNVNHATNTVDLWLVADGGAYFNVPIVGPLATTNTGSFELPDLKTVGNIQKAILNLGNQDASSTSNNQNTVNVENLYYFENALPGREDLDDPTTNYGYAVVALADLRYGKTQPVCLGFFYTVRNQMLFNTQNFPVNAPSLTKQFLPNMDGAYLHRTNSDVYTWIDSNGNTEFFHPNGSFFRLAEAPTENNGGQYHVDLSNSNAKAESQNPDGSYTGNQLTTAWNVAQKVGADGNLNSQRTLYFHMEVVTEQGTVAIDIDKTTGNVTIQTPKGSSQGGGASNNTFTVNCNGNVVIESVQGDVTVQSVNGNIGLQAENSITIETESGQNDSVLLAPNSPQQDNLVFLNSLIKKFNAHTHIDSSGSPTTPPNLQLEITDGTSVTKAG